MCNREVDTRLSALVFGEAVGSGSQMDGMAVECTSSRESSEHGRAGSDEYGHAYEGSRTCLCILYF